MKTLSLTVLCIITLLSTVSLGESPQGSREQIPKLIDGLREERIKSRVTVLIFVRPYCRLCSLYADRITEMANTWQQQDVAVIAVVLPSHASDAAKEFKTKHGWPFPLVTDDEQKLIEFFDIRVVPEVVVLDQRQRLRYRGLIDDQYGVGIQRKETGHEYLRNAVSALLDGNDVPIGQTQAVGCRINRRDQHQEKPPTQDVTYCRDVAPILQQHCISCHRPGMSGPFSLTNYSEAQDWAEMICEVVSTGLMPPWHAAPDHGRFSNENVLTIEEKRILQTWTKNGCEEGDARDLPSPARFPESWQIGVPDVVFSTPKFTVPSEGIIEYQYFTIDTGFTEDKWVTAVEANPTNPAVVHHCSINLVRPDGRRVRLSGQAVGTPPSTYPPGMAKRIPAGCKIQVVLHYQAIGTEQQDRTRIGLKLADASEVEREVRTIVMIDHDLHIPPYADNHRVEMCYEAPRDQLLLSMYPHMHLRGKKFRYEAHYPGGTTEILLDVPRWDFNWQHRYKLATPKRLPAGTILKAIAHYDNSTNNPFNPDPSVDVYEGEQTEDEMFNSFTDVVDFDQDLTSWSYRAHIWTKQVISYSRWPSLLLLAFLGFRMAGSRDVRAAEGVLQ